MGISVMRAHGTLVVCAALAFCGVALLGGREGRGETGAEGAKEPIMSERKGAVTMKGNPLTLVGNEVKVGPDGAGLHADGQRPVAGEALRHSAGKSV